MNYNNFKKKLDKLIPNNDYFFSNNCLYTKEGKIKRGPNIICSLYLFYITISYIKRLINVHYIYKLTIFNKYNITIYLIYDTIITIFNLYFMYYMCYNCNGIIGFIVMNIITFGIVTILNIFSMEKILSLNDIRNYINDM